MDNRSWSIDHTAYAMNDRTWSMDQRTCSIDHRIFSMAHRSCCMVDCSLGGALVYLGGVFGGSLVILRTFDLKIAFLAIDFF